MLVLDIEWLTGVARLASDPSDRLPDWPPQPDRIFSALTASWGALGQPHSGQLALEWLETCVVPQLFVVPTELVSFRPTVDVYVPVNDPKPDKLLRAARNRQARQFPSCSLPGNTSVHLQLTWAETPAGSINSALQDLAASTSHLGHSSSLVRMQFRLSEGEQGLGNFEQAEVVSAPYPGRLSELIGLHKRHMDGDARARPRPTQTGASPTAPRQEKNVFSGDWLVLAHAGGDRPDIRAAATLARRLRNALIAQVPDPVPSWLSGHQEDGKPYLEPHMAIVPLANVGWEHADGRLMGLGIILPSHIQSRWDDSTPQLWQEKRTFEGALAGLTGKDGLELRLGRAGVWKLLIEPSPAAKSLRPSRYARQARSFQTVTPIALDRHLKKSGEAALEEAASIISRSCLNTGLPEPLHLKLFKHSAVNGAPSAWPSGGSPAHLNWTKPAFLKQRQLFHAQIEFAEPVSGPVLIGAGRFAGLGLCLPVTERGR